MSNLEILQDKFREDGYVLIPNAISPRELGELFGEISQILAITIRNIGVDPSAIEGVDQNSHLPLLRPPICTVSR